MQDQGCCAGSARDPERSRRRDVTGRFDTLVGHGLRRRLSYLLLWNFLAWLRRLLLRLRQSVDSGPADAFVQTRSDFSRTFRGFQRVFAPIPEQDLERPTFGRERSKSTRDQVASVLNRQRASRKTITIVSASSKDNCRSRPGSSDRRRRTRSRASCFKYLREHGCGSVIQFSLPSRACDNLAFTIGKRRFGFSQVNPHPHWLGFLGLGFSSQEPRDCSDECPRAFPQRECAVLLVNTPQPHLVRQEPMQALQQSRKT